VAKLPNPLATQEFFEAPTEKRNIPAELLDPPPPVYVTTKLRKVEIDQLVAKERAATERDKSGMRAAISNEAIERYEVRERRETLPAPPDDDLDELDPEAENEIAGRAR
jgi:hypothetical protein